MRPRSQKRGKRCEVSGAIFGALVLRGLPDLFFGGEPHVGFIKKCPLVLLQKPEFDKDPCSEKDEKKY